MTVTAWVPLKSHSERVPNKNVRSFNGRPLFHWILAKLTAAAAVDEVVVNTDSDRIAETAADEFDARVIRRPEELHGGHVTVTELLKNDLSVIDSEAVLMTFCTAPLLTTELIEQAIDQFREATEDGYDSLFTVTAVQDRLWSTDGEPLNHDPEKLQRTQDLTPIYEENSNIYIFTRTAIQSRDPDALHVGDRPITFEMPREKSVDIDEPFDFTFAENLHKKIHGENPELIEVIGQENSDSEL